MTTEGRAGWIRNADGPADSQQESGPGERPSALDDAALIAAEIGGTPIARVTVADGRGGAISGSVGLAERFEALVHVGFTEAVWRSGEPIVIPDGPGGRPTAEAILAGEAGLRFYAGLPIRDRDGRVVGVIEIADRDARPDPLPDRTMRALERLGSRTTDAVRAEGRDGPVPQDDVGELLAALFVQSPSFMALLRGTEHRVQHANPGFVELMGGRNVVGHAAAELLAPGPAVARYLAVLDEVLATGQPYSSRDARFSSVPIDGAAPEERVIDFVFQPIKDRDGRAIGILVQGTDVTERSRAVSALEEAERRRRFLFELLWGLREATSEDAMLDHAGRHLGRTLGLARVGFRIHLGNRDVLEVEAWSEGEAGPAVAVDVRREGRVRLSLDLRPRAAEILDPFAMDLAREVAETTWDTVEGRRSGVALRRTQDRHRALVNHIDKGICIVEPIFDRAGQPSDFLFLETNPAFDQHWGGIGLPGRRLGEIPTRDAETWAALCRRVLADGQPARADWEDGQGTASWEIHALRIGEADDLRIALLFTDITARKRLDERRTLLNEELAHRLKNNLALVSSIVTQTLRSAADIESARTALGDRIMALSKAHDVLLTGQRDAASVDAVVRSALALHDSGGRTRLDGPPLPLGAKASLSLALIVHELATNAAKYGALSVPGGRIRIFWQAGDPADAEALLVLEWREEGGPPVAAPAKTSFGTRLIRMGLSGGEGASVEFDYAPAGLRCRLVAPLRDLQAAELGS